MKNNYKHTSQDLEECPMCEKKSVYRILEQEEFVYAVGKETVTLKAEIPFGICKECNFKFTDHEADDIKHEAVCHHFGLLTPAQILSIRSNYRLNTNEFSELTGLGTASLSRWENGVLIQNKTNDNFLYLLGYPDNVKRLKTRMNKPKKKSFAKFRSLSKEDEEKLSKEAKGFKLCAG